MIVPRKKKNKKKRKKKEKAPNPPEIIFDTHCTYPNGHKKRYRLGKFLGKGSFGTVFELQSQDSGVVYAGKCIWKKHLKGKSVKKIINEIEIHKILDHPNVVRFNRYFEDNDFVYFVLELCERETMVELLKRRIRLTEPEVRYYLNQVIDAVSYLHKQNIIHRDLKLGNLLIDKNLQIKLADFGLAIKLQTENEKRTTICGTPNYIAPEVLSGSHSFEVDVWSIGCLTYTLLIGKPPFETGKLKDTYDRIMKQVYSFPSSVTLTSQAKRFINCMLTNKATHRPSIDELKSNPFFLLYTPTMLSPKALKEMPEFPSSLGKQDSHKSPQLKKKVLGKRPSPYNAERGRKRKKSSIDDILRDLGRELERSVLQETLKEGEVRECGESISSSPHAPRSTSSPEARSDTEKSRRPPTPASTKSRCQPPSEVFSLFDSTPPSTTKSCVPRPKHRLPPKPPIPRANTETPPTNQKISVQSPLKTGSEDPSKFSIPGSEDPVRILVWVLCKNHGLGYALSNGCFGVCFNDDTKIVLQPDRKTYCYIDRGPYGNSMWDTFGMHHGTADKGMKTYQTDRQKKVLILMKMHEHLNRHRSGLPAGSPTLLKSTDIVYVTRWRGTVKGTIIKLSNKLQYIRLADNTVITLWNKNNITCEFHSKEKSNIFCTREELRTDHPNVWRNLVNVYTDQVKTQKGC